MGHLRWLSLALSMLLLSAIPAHAAIAFVQAPAPTSSGSNVGAQTFGSNTAAGNFIVCGFEMSGGTAIDLTSVVDTGLNTYTSAVYGSDAGSTRGTSIWYAMNISGGATVVTATHVDASTVRTSCREYSGVSLTSALTGTPAVNAQTSGSGSDNCSTSTTTPAVNGSLIIGIIVAADTIAAGTGFGNLASANFEATEDAIQSTAGAIAATWTIGSPGSACTMGVAAFTSATGGPANSRHRSRQF